MSNHNCLTKELLTEKNIHQERQIALSDHIDPNYSWFCNTAALCNVSISFPGNIPLNPTLVAILILTVLSLFCETWGYFTIFCRFSTLELRNEWKNLYFGIQKPVYHMVTDVLATQGTRASAARAITVKPPILAVSRLALQLSLSNPLKPGVKSRR